jgi:hypothetical protein
MSSHPLRSPHSLARPARRCCRHGTQLQVSELQQLAVGEVGSKLRVTQQVIFQCSLLPLHLHSKCQSILLRNLQKLLHLIRLLARIHHHNRDTVQDIKGEPADSQCTKLIQIPS